MTDGLATSLWPLLTMGFVGSLHCVGMCGGLVTAVCMRCPGETRKKGLALYQVGRLSGYALLGLAAGVGGEVVSRLGGHRPQALLALLAGGAMVVFAGHLLGWLPAIPFGRSGGRLGRALGRVARRLTDGVSARDWYLLGLVNGFLPCGLVYAALALAMARGDVPTSMLAMVVFGIGTVPAMLLAPVLMRRLEHALRVATVRLTAFLVAGLGLLTMARAFVSPGLGGG